MMKSRDAIVITGYRARKPTDASFSGGALANEIELADGRRMLFHLIEADGSLRFLSSIGYLDDASGIEYP
jgi:hypothetical protein